MSVFNRNNISLNIVGTQGAEYYDQICALSQRTINENFKVLFSQRPSLKELYYWDSQGDGNVLNAILDPPQVKLELGSSDRPELYFEIHFKSGSIKLRSGNVINIDNWVITVRSEVSDNKISEDPDNDEDTASAAEAQMEEVRISYDVTHLENAIKEARENALKGAKDNTSEIKEPTKLVAGDYSIQRLYCSVAQGQWSTPVESHTYITDPSDSNKRISLLEWRKAGRSSAARTMADAVSRLLGNWAEDNRESAFWNLGIQVRLPTVNDVPRSPKPTCVPTDVRFQNYPYISEASQLEHYKAIQKGETAIPITARAKLGHDYNCFVFCETVSRPLPTGSRLDYGGNLAEASQEPSSTDIPGTFVLDHRLYLEKRILESLKEICARTSVIPIKPEMFTDPVRREHRFRSRYVVGGEPTDPESDYPGLPSQNVQSSTFDFKWEEKPKEEDRYRYVWRRTYQAPGSNDWCKLYTDCDFAPVYRKWNIEACNVVMVSWKPGDDKLTVKGDISYRHWEAYSKNNNSDFQWNSTGNDCYYGKFNINVTWSFTIQLSDGAVSLEQKKKALKKAAQLRRERKAGKLPDAKDSELEDISNGVIQPTIDGLDATTGLPSDFDVSFDSVFVRDNTDAEMRDEVTRQLKKTLSNLASNLKASFKDVGGFTYPGTQTLVFLEPRLNNFGDILTTIDYVDLEEGLVQVIIPDPQDIKRTETRKVDPVVSDSTITSNDPAITWISTIKYNAGKKTATITLTGQNTSSQPKAFNEIDIQLLPTHGINCLFSTAAEEWTGPTSSTQQPEIDHGGTVARVAQPVSSSTFTIAQTNVVETLRLTAIQRSNSLIFRLDTAPAESKLPYPKTPRFTTKAGGNFKLVFEGPISEPGSYILQLDELWNEIDYKREMKGKRAATYFLKCCLNEDGSSTVYSVRQVEADETRGVMKLSYR